VRVAIRKIDGVQTVEVSLNRGLAVITFKPENRIGIGRVRDLIRSNGFTPKDADVRIRGRVVERDGGLVLTLPDQDRAYRLEDHPDAAATISRLTQSGRGKIVVIVGRVPETRGRGERTDIIQVRNFTLALGS
jgi:copper chaperone CopZ